MYPHGWLPLLGRIGGGPFSLPEVAEAIEDLSERQNVHQDRPHNFFNPPLFNMQSFEKSIFETKDKNEFKKGDYPFKHVNIHKHQIEQCLCTCQIQKKKS